MALTLDGLPQAITHEQLTEWLAFIGIDVKNVRSLRVDRGGLRVEVRALNPQGKPFSIGDERATHVIAIPIGDPGEWEEAEAKA